MNDTEELYYSQKLHLDSIYDETHGTDKSFMRSRLPLKEWIEQQILEKNDRKHIQRNNRSREIMQDYPNQYHCASCVHGITGNCEDLLECGCEYHFDTETRELFPIEQRKR